jgi:hypothetical protein
MVLLSYRSADDASPKGSTTKKEAATVATRGPAATSSTCSRPQPDRLDQTSSSPPSRPSAATLMATPPQVAGAWFGMAVSTKAATPASHGRGARLDEAPPAVRRGSGHDEGGDHHGGADELGGRDEEPSGAGVVGEDEAGAKQVQQPDQGQAGPPQPRPVGPVRDEGFDHGDRRGNGHDHEAGDEAEMAGADAQPGDEGGLPLLPPGLRPGRVVVVEVAGVEQALVDQAGLDQPEGGAKQQDRRQPRPVRQVISRMSTATVPYSGMKIPR